HPRVLLSKIYKRTGLRLPIKDLGNDAFSWASNPYKGQSSHPRVLLSRIYKRTSLRLPIKDLGNDVSGVRRNMNSG
ncbi:hypothetical protein, partial [Vibrio breoganii]|uniref:hypothetical protein n=1 Tax=Vibrio breoganii TaxID=553239 RepID=UPI001A7E119F